jgi:hypothetical protein
MRFIATMISAQLLATVATAQTPPRKPYPSSMRFVLRRLLQRSGWRPAKRLLLKKIGSSMELRMLFRFSMLIVVFALILQSQPSSAHDPRDEHSNCEDKCRIEFKQCDHRQRSQSDTGTTRVCIPQQIECLRRC